MRVTNISAVVVSFSYNGTRYSMNPAASLDFPDSAVPDTRHSPSDIVPGLGKILANLGGLVTINPGDQVAAKAYTPGDASKWASTPPTTQQQALDRMAALLFTLHSATIP
jgi:hypothetical protein